MNKVLFIIISAILLLGTSIGLGHLTLFVLGFSVYQLILNGVIGFVIGLGGFILAYYIYIKIFWGN